MARITEILTVTRGGILYSDIAEIIRWIEFAEFARHDLLTAPPQHTIGRYGLQNAPLPYIEFFTTPITRLEFEREADLRDLLKQIKKQGWHVVCEDGAKAG